MTIIFDSLSGLAGLFKYAIRTASLTLFAVEILYGFPLFAIIFWIVAADNSLTRLILALLITVSLVIFLGLFVSFQFTMVKSISRFAERAAIGRRVFDALFDIILGGSDESPGGKLTASRSMHGMSIAELEIKLKAAGDEILSQKTVAAKAPRIALWFAEKVQRTLVWATIRVVLCYCSAGNSGTSDSTIDLLVLRQNLTDVIDTHITDYLKLNTTRMIISIFIGVSLLAILLACGIRQIPF